MADVKTAVPNLNFTFNGDFEIWGSGASSAPTGWLLGGAGASAAKNTTAGQFKRGTASVALTRSGADVTLSQLVSSILGFNPSAAWQGVTVTLGCWARATVASRARIAINDGVGESNSAYHSGGSSFEFLTVTRVLDAAATQLSAIAQLTTGDTTAQFDGMVLVIGEHVSGFVPSAWRGRKSILQFGGPTRAGNTTSYSGGPSEWQTADANEGRIPVPFNFVARNLRLKATSSPGGSDTFIATLRKNAVDSALIATISGSATTASDTTNEVVFTTTSPDDIQLKLVTSATAASSDIAGSVEIEEVP